MNPDAAKQLPPEWTSHAENVRENYRREGREQERRRIITLLIGFTGITTEQARLCIERINQPQGPATDPNGIGEL